MMYSFPSLSSKNKIVERYAKSLQSHQYHLTPHLPVRNRMCEKDLPLWSFHCGKTSVFFFPLTVELEMTVRCVLLPYVCFLFSPTSLKPLASSFASVLCLCSPSLHSSSSSSSSRLSRGGEPESDASSFVIPLNTLSIPPQSLSFISHQEKCQA